MVRLSEDDVKMLNFIVASSGESKSKVIRSGLKMMYNLEKVRSLTD